MDEKATPKPEVKAKAVEAEVVPETKPEPIVIKADAAKAPEPPKEAVAPAPEPTKDDAHPVDVDATAPETTAPPIEPQSEPKAQEPKLFSVQTDAYSAWVTQNGDKSYVANLELVGGSAYNWPASSASEAEALLKYHIANQKL